MALAYTNFVRQLLLSQSAKLSVEGDPAADLSVPIGVFLVYPGLDYGFINGLREFISLRLDRVDPYKESNERFWMG